MDNLSAVSGSTGEQYVQQNGNESNTVQEQGFDYDFNSPSDVGNTTSFEDGIDVLENSGITDILTGEDKSDPKIEAIKSEIINEDGSINYKQIQRQFADEKFSYNDLVTALGVTPEEDEQARTSTFTIDNAVFTFKHNDYSSRGGDLAIDLYHCDYNHYSARYGQELNYHADELPKNTVTPSHDTELDIFNEDNSINSDKIGELFETGNMDYFDFCNLFGGIQDRSFNMSAELEDGTKVIGHGDNGINPSIQIISPDDKVKTFYGGVFNSTEERNKIDNFRSECVGEDNLINPDKVGELLSSGEMSSQDFIKMCNYLTYKQYEYIPEDNSFNIGSRIPELYSQDCPENEFSYKYFYSNMTIHGYHTGVEEGEPFLWITTPDGREYKFEYGSKK